MEEKKYEVEVGGQTMTFSTGILALQASGSVLARLGGTEVLATVVMPEEAREDIGYFPLMVDFEEKLYAAGKIKGSRFIKQEGRPADSAILSARLIDRAIRPLFPKWLKNDVQVILTVLSFDKENDPDIVGMNAAIAALMISHIPWKGPIAGARASHVEGNWIINPSYGERLVSDFNIDVAGTSDKTLMIEADAPESSENLAYEGVEFIQKHLSGLIDTFSKMQKEIGKEKIQELQVEETEEKDTSTVDYKKETEKFISENIEKALFVGKTETKLSRKKAVKVLLDQLEDHLKELQVGKEKRKKATSLGWEIVESFVTQAIIKDSKRVDGRALDEIRELTFAAGVLSRTHGSGLFSRGETQVLSVVTLASPGAEQILDTLEENDTKKRYMHHYNFPPYSVGEAGPMRGPGRRDIGHGALAEKALVRMIPDKESFPYTIRVVSEVLGSNGSSSMGSVCGSTMSLLDAGVPIKANIAGIAMGLASDKEGNYKIITDLQDLEDGQGGMDFKVAGSREGITAIQLDTKTEGLSNEIVKETLERAKTARLEILDKMEKIIKKPNELSEFAPRITSMKINPEKIRLVIGTGGKTINEIIDTCGVEIDIDDDGLVMITSEKAEGAKQAIEWIERLTHDIEAGEKYEGKVVRIMDFGAFVELVPGKDGMVHISKLANGRVEKVEDVCKVGDTLSVQVDEIDDQGRINLRVQGVEKDSSQSFGAPRRGVERDAPRRSRPGGSGFGGNNRAPRR